MKVLKYGLGGLIVGGITYLLFKDKIMDCQDYSKSRLQNRLDKEKAYNMKNEINKKAGELIVSTFVKMLLNNINISLEEAILKFENAEEGVTLDEFAESKSRVSKSYISVYDKYFKEARSILYL